MPDAYRSRTVEQNLNEILGPLAKHIAEPEAFCIEIGVWDGTTLPVTYYAVIRQEDRIVIGESTYGSPSIAVAVADLLKEFHEYIDSLEDEDE